MKQAGWFLGLVGLVVLDGSIPAKGQDQTPSAREQQLEELVRSLSQRVEQLESRLNTLEGGGETNPGTSAKIAELQSSVEELKKQQPTAEEWASVKKWTSDPLTLRPFWKDGLRFENTGKSVSLKIGGRIQEDYALFEEDGGLGRSFGDAFADGTEFRTARLYIEGEVYDNIEFKAQYDFANGETDFKDVYLGLVNVGDWGSLRVGQFKEPFSLDELTSSNYITFMERGLPNAFVPGRNVGLMWYRPFADERVTGAAGIFRKVDSSGRGQSDQQFAATARVTALPWYEDGGKRLFHVGLGYTLQEYKSEVRFSARPESHLAPRLADTGTISADSGNIVGAELAYVHGPLSFQSEFMQAFIGGSDIPVRNSQFWGGYVLASYFLTGETRPYKKSAGVFDRVRPLHNWREDGGWGAWELAARYSHLELNDGIIRGGRLEDLSLGVNWYLNPNVRVMWDYVLSNPSHGGIVNIFETRVQIAF